MVFLRAILVLLLAFAATADRVDALGFGRFDAARPASGGCGNFGLCHGAGSVAGLEPAQNPLVFLDGLPDAYVPGEAYTLTILVLGPALPLAGFNLEATGGSLKALSPSVPGGGAARVGKIVDECTALEQAALCDPAGGVPCEVAVSEECPMYGPEYPECACTPGDGVSECRPCDPDRIVSVQATHVQAAIVPTWSVAWTAPCEGFGDVRFYLAGNSTNGTEAAPADFWGFASGPSTVSEGAGTCSP